MMKKLWMNVESEFGKSPSSCKNCSFKRRRKKIKCFFGDFLQVSNIHIDSIRVFHARNNFYSVQEISTTTVALVSTFAGTLALIPALSVVIQEVWRRSRGKWILNEVKKFEQFDRTNFSEETGFMGKVKKEVEYLFDSLRTELIVDDEINRRFQVRLLVFLDDLDRCSTPDTIMKVLQTVSLLLVDAPITCYLAIDRRRVVTSIESHFGEQFVIAGFNGYEYLDKVVQIPFCLPNLEKDQKEIFIMKELQNSTYKRF